MRVIQAGGFAASLALKLVTKNRLNRHATQATCEQSNDVVLFYFFSPVVPSTTPTHGYFVLSPDSLASRDQDGDPSDSTIDIYDLTEK